MIMTMSTAFVILKPTRPHVITLIRIGYLNLLVARKLGRLAVRLDTFEAENQHVFYIGTNQPEVLTEIRRHILANFENLPVAVKRCTGIFIIRGKIRQRHLPDD